jgi:hypothetical protein
MGQRDDLEVIRMFAIYEKEREVPEWRPANRTFNA